MNSIRVEAKDVKRIMQAVGSRKKTAYIVPSLTVTYSGTYWDGGSRTTYTAVELATGRPAQGPHFNPPQFGGPSKDPVIEIPPGFVIVEHGTFCGKPATPCIHVHPDDMPRLLPQEVRSC